MINHEIINNHSTTIKWSNTSYTTIKWSNTSYTNSLNITNTERPHFVGHPLWMRRAGVASRPASSRRCAACKVARWRSRQLSARWPGGGPNRWSGKGKAVGMAWEDGRRGGWWDHGRNWVVLNLVNKTQWLKTQWLNKGENHPIGFEKLGTTQFFSANNYWFSAIVCWKHNGWIKVNNWSGRMVRKLWFYTDLNWFIKSIIRH